ERVMVSVGWVEERSDAGPPTEAYCLCRWACVAPLLDPPYSRQLPRQHLEWVGPLRVHPQRRRRLVPTVDHAVLAPRVLAAAVLLPRRLLDQVVERRMVLVGDQVARPLPPFDVPRRVAPRRTRQLPLAGQELQVHRRRPEPVLAQQRL